MNKNHLLARLASHYQYRDTPFRLSSGQESRKYLDCRAALSDPVTLNYAATAILDLIDDETEAVGGLTMGADPLAIATSLVSLKTWGLNWFSVRKEPKQHGTGKLIEGLALLLNRRQAASEPGDLAASEAESKLGFNQLGVRVAVLEDVSTTGASALKAVAACHSAGLSVGQVIALVDRGGVELMRSLLPGPEVIAVLPFTDVAVVGFARQIAIEAHRDQRYGDPATGPLYSATHLPQVVNVLAEMLTIYDPYLLAAAWLHDTPEDTGTSIDALREKGVPGVVLAHVDACTDGPGKNRKERKQRSYQLIPQTTNTVLLKLADRICNAEATKREGKDSLMAMYRKEQPEFYDKLKNSTVSPDLSAQPFWDRLEKALA